MNSELGQVTQDVVKDATGLDLLDGTLDRLAKLKDKLGARLSVVTKFQEETNMARPIEAARSGLVERVQRLDSLCDEIDQIIYRLDI